MMGMVCFGDAGLLRSIGISEARRGKPDVVALGEGGEAMEAIPDACLTKAHVTFIAATATS